MTIDPNDKIGNISYYDFSEAIEVLFELELLREKLKDIGIDLAYCGGYYSSIYTIKKLIIFGMGLDETYGDEIDYYCYECNFGRNKNLGDCEIDNKKYSLKSTSDLWVWIKALSEKKTN